MYTFILLITIIVVSFIGAVVIDKSSRSYDFEWAAFGLTTIGILTLIGLIITACSCININTRFEATLNEYEVIQEMVESYDGQDYGNMTELTKSVVEMNILIARHKAHYKSIWTGPWFSEDIANLKPISFGKVLKE